MQGLLSYVWAVIVNNFPNRANCQDNIFHYCFKIVLVACTGAVKPDSSWTNVQHITFSHLSCYSEHMCCGWLNLFVFTLYLTPNLKNWNRNNKNKKRNSPVPFMFCAYYPSMNQWVMWGLFQGKVLHLQKYQCSDTKQNCRTNLHMLKLYMYSLEVCLVLKLLFCF